MPLKVAVVGAGIGGLSTAVALNRAGHHVEVFERSSFLNEVGAAIHAAPNAVRILQSWDCDLSSLKAVKCQHLSLWTSEGEYVGTPVVTTDMQSRLGIDEDWLLTHRVDLHNTLRGLAEVEVNGRRPAVHLASKIASIDALAGHLTFEDGSRYSADLIVGADGLHSKTIHAVFPGRSAIENTGQVVFRFLVPVDKLKTKPRAEALISRVGLDSFNGFTRGDRRIILYPCRNGTLLNAAALLPTPPGMKLDEGSSWLSSGTTEQLLSCFDDFGDAIKDICVLGEDVKLWNLATRLPPQIFYKDRVVLVGDAAHPMLPFQGQGGAQAIEDAAALEVLFPPDTTPDQIPERLSMYNQVRYNHAVTVMMMSRVRDDKRESILSRLREYVPDAESPPDMYAYSWQSKPAELARKVLAAH